jgi:hypothetical protein
MYRHARSDDCQKDDKDFVTRGSSTTPDTMIIYTKNIFIAGPNLFTVFETEAHDRCFLFYLGTPE